jgi:CHAT domain-containing protein/tetratricopeptide (TPR) repeat protein
MLVPGGNGAPAAPLSPAQPGPAAALAEPGIALYRQGDYAGSLIALDDALARTVAARGDGHADTLPIRNARNRLLLKLGRIKEAWKGAEQALQIAEAAFGGQSAEAAVPLASLAEIYFNLGLLDRCHLAAERALAILRLCRGEEHCDTAKACVRLGVALTEMGAYERATGLHERALAVMRAQGRKDWVAAILASLAATHLAAGAAAAALPLYQAALATARAAFGESHATTGAYLATLADYFLKVGDDARALTLYRQTHALLRRALGETHPDVARALLSVGLLEQKKRADAGQAAIFSALAVLCAYERRPRALADAYLCLAKMLQASSAGILFWKLAIIDIERTHMHVARLDGKLERSFLRKNADAFRELGDGLICRGRLPEAQRVLAIIKERELFSLTGIGTRRTKLSLTPLEIAWTRRGAKLLAAITASLTAADAAEGASAQAQRARVHARIRKAGVQLREWFAALVAAFAAAETAPLNEASVAAQAAGPLGRRPAPGTALLQYLFAPDRLSMSIVLTTSAMQRERRVVLRDGEVNRLVFTLREALQSRSAGFRDSAQRLYRILIAPVAEDLQANGIVTLSLWLDDVLRYLPMGALHDGERYLLERFELVLAAGTGGKTRSAAAVRAAGLGVSRRIAGYRPLPAVREELAAIIRDGKRHGGVLPGIVRLDGAFTADALRRALAEDSVVHIASHFVFEAAREAASYLLLGDGSKLTLAQLSEFRFGAVDLVVLSACNTAVGGGHRQSGREIEGLGALVRDHGARKVLATLWPVADRTTAALMREFYRLTYEAGVRPAQALRQAQLALLGDGTPGHRPGRTRSLVDPDDVSPDRDAYPGASHPFYWAPYILMEEVGVSH